MVSERLFRKSQIILLFLLLSSQVNCENANKDGHINRYLLVTRHNIIAEKNNEKSPMQVGNGEFAFGVDITGLQSFVPFNTMSHWAWHSDPIPEGYKVEDFKGQVWDTHARPVRYSIPNDEQRQLSQWLAENPHRFNLARIGFVLKKSDGSPAKIDDLQNTSQQLNLWTGLITSKFELQGQPVLVYTVCHPEKDQIAVKVQSPLIQQGRLAVKINFPYASEKGKSGFADYVGDWEHPELHKTILKKNEKNRADFKRILDSTEYYAALQWFSDAILLQEDKAKQPHQFLLQPAAGSSLEFVCAFSPEKLPEKLPSPQECIAASEQKWSEFWSSGAAIDLSQSTDPRWRELERRIVLSQYLMAVNEAGSLPPQEAGLVNNGWHGRFHFEMIWWHGVHYALWNRWDMWDKSLVVYSKFLESSKQRAEQQGYKGARWPKCTAYDGREWPHVIHAMLIWQQPHPIYFAELDYRLHPTIETLNKWKDIVFNTADFMASYAFLDKKADRYVLGPPVFVVSENTDPMQTINPAFELGYWRFGLRIANQWRQRLNLEPVPEWNQVLNKLAPLPAENNLYILYEGIGDMWTKYNFEHPALIGTYGMLPGDGVNTSVLGQTLDKILSVWNFDRTWGWDFPMLAMAAARLNRPETAVDLLLHPSAGFQFDEHGLATGGPFPYFPSNGALLTAVAMMAAGWDGAPDIQAPGFPKNGKWYVKYEGFNIMP